jgi:ATP adenylyltransferase
VQPTRHCSFCELPGREETVLRGTGVSAVPSLGAYVEGWTLVVPDEHVQAIADLSPGSRAAFDEAVDFLRQRITDTYGPVISFEHGSVGSGRTAGCGVDHAHLHIVPHDIDIRGAVAALVAEVGSFAWERCERLPTRGAPSDYVWISDGTGSWIAYAEVLPSQVIRRAIARQLGIQTWDWKQDHRMDNVTATLERLRAVSSDFATTR